jgi:hypothetical protein
MCDVAGTSQKEVTIVLLDEPSNKLIDSYTYSVTPLGSVPRGTVLV